MFKLLKSVHVYGPEDLGVMDVLICHDKVVEVGVGLDYRLPNLTTIDGAGLLALPGYIDQHVHVTGGGGEGSFKTRVPELKLTDAIKAGVTTVVGLLGTDAITRSVENLVAKTKGLNEEGITAYCLTGSYQYPTRTVTGDVMKDVAFIRRLWVSRSRSRIRSRYIARRRVRLASDVGWRVSSAKPGILDSISAREAAVGLSSGGTSPQSHFRPTHGKGPRSGVRVRKLGLHRLRPTGFYACKIQPRLNAA